MYRPDAMSRFVVVFLFLIALPGSLVPTNPPHRFQEAATMPRKKSPAMSAREKAGLRGPVRECTEETTRLAVPGFPEAKFTNATEYDTEGRIVKTVAINPDGSKWISSNVYDDQGRLAKTISGKADGSVDETIYHYDEKSRLVDYTGRGATGSETTRFEYDQQGRKTRVVTSNVPASPAGPYRGTSVAYALEGLDLYHPVPQGGTVKTVYDESDRPVETQVYTAEGQRMQRLVQSYDAAGRPTETKVVLGDVAAMFPAEMKAQLLNEAGGAEELQQQVAQLFGGQGEMFKTSYVYDAQGRLTERRIHVGYSEETVTSYVYDSDGNKIKETSKTSGDANPPRNDGGVQVATADTAASARDSEVTYSYKYDGYGNWTEQTTHSKPRPDGASENSAICLRTITYY
jgi:YD repeat-containing protein